MIGDWRFKMSQGYTLKPSEDPKYTVIKEISESMDNINKPNKYTELLYNKPKGYFKERKYYRKEVKPLIRALRKGPIDHYEMVAFSNFIKVLEMAFFYHNDSKNIDDVDTHIISDNKIDNDTKKNLTILMEKEKVTIIFDLEQKNVQVRKNYGSFDTDNIHQYIVNITCRNEFGKKLVTKFEVINQEVVNQTLTPHTYNLLYNINQILQNTMADLLETYYKKA